MGKLGFLVILAVLPFAGTKESVPHSNSSLSDFNKLVKIAAPSIDFITALVDAINSFIQLYASKLEDEDTETKIQLKVLESGQKVLESGQKVLESGQKVLESGQKVLESGQKALEKQVEALWKHVGLKNDDAKIDPSLSNSLESDTKIQVAKSSEHVRTKRQVGHTLPWDKTSGASVEL